MRRGVFAALVASTAAGAPLAACSGASGSGLFIGADGAPSDAQPAEATPNDGPVGDGGDLRIDPLELGRMWVFDVKAIDGGTITAGCTAGVETSSVVGPGAIHNGSPTVRYKPLCDNFLVDALVEGDKVTAFPVDGGTFSQGVVLDTPVEEGHTWNYAPTGPQFVWHDAGTVTVPAGTFNQCWARGYATGSEARFVYCRGVGLVELEDTDFGYRAVLTSKNF